jgi:hypothetical protein
LKYIFLLFFVCLTQSSQAQKLSSEEFRKEMEITLSILLDVHANPYAFQKEEAYHYFKDSILNTCNLKDSIPVITAYKYFSKLVSLIKCAHSGAFPPIDMEGVVNQFPQGIKILEHIGYISKDFPDFDLQLGDQVLSINGIPWHEILSEGKQLHSSDGISPLNIYLFEKRIGFDVPILLNNPKEYILEIQRNSKAMKVIVEASKSVVLSNTSPNYAFSLIGTKSNIGLIRVEKFPSNEKLIYEFEKFCRITRNVLKRKKIKDLIIDIRDNGGGDRIDLLLRIFTPFSFDLMQSSSLDTTNLFKYKNDLVFHGYSYEQIIKLPAQSTSSRQVDFQGELSLDLNLYVFVNGRTASAASHFASLVQEHQLGVIVGSETGGRASGCNGTVYGSYYLPFSKVEIFLPLMVNIYAVNQVENPDHGVIPDFPIKEAMTDKFELTKLIEFIEVGVQKKGSR